MAAKMTGHKKTQVGHIAFAPLRAINARSWMHIALLPDVGFRLWDLGYIGSRFRNQGLCFIGVD